MRLLRLVTAARTSPDGASRASMWEPARVTSLSGGLSVKRVYVKPTALQGLTGSHQDRIGNDSTAGKRTAIGARETPAPTCTPLPGRVRFLAVTGYPVRGKGRSLPCGSYHPVTCRPLGGQWATRRVMSATCPPTDSASRKCAKRRPINAPGHPGSSRRRSTRITGVRLCGWPKLKAREKPAAVPVESRRP